MSHQYKNILIAPALADNSETTDPYISFRTSNATSNVEMLMHVYANNNGTLSFSDGQGELFRISNDLTNTVAVTGVFTALANSTLTGAVRMSNTVSITGAVNVSSNVAVSGSLTLLSTVTANSSVGATGQSLSSNGTGVFWRATATPDDVIALAIALG